MTEIYSISANTDICEDNSISFTGKKYFDDTTLLKHATYNDELRYPWTYPNGKNPEIPNELEYLVSSKQELDKADILSDDILQDILSIDLVKALQQAGSLNCEIIPVRLINELGDEVYKDRFISLLHIEFCDCFDYENSDYRPKKKEVLERATERKKKQVKGIRKAALIEPSNGFPSIFRLLAKPIWALLTTEAGREAILDAGIKGVEFHLRSTTN